MKRVMTDLLLPNYGRLRPPRAPTMHGRREEENLYDTMGNAMRV